MTEITPVALADMLAASRQFALREAIVGRLATLFPGVQVKGHPGKIDISDVVAQDIFTTPSINVAIVRSKNDPRLSSADDIEVSIAAYVVVEDMEIGGRLATRDEIGPAICEALMLYVSQPDASGQFGLTDIGLPDDVQSHPLFTSKSFAKGAAFYAVTWKQEIFAVGEPLFQGGDDV